MLSKIVSSLITSAALLTCSYAAEAADRLVPSQYATIQAAIDASANGDVVRISPGTYAGPIDLKGKPITLRGSDQGGASVVSGGAPVVRCTSTESSATVIENLTITGGTGTNSAGIRIEGSSPTIRNCKVIGNVLGIPPGTEGCGSSVYGAGVAIRGGAPSISNCLIGGNRIIVASATASGAGVYIEDSEAILSDCTITGNYVKATYDCCACGAVGIGAGACIVGTGVNGPTFLRCTFSANQLEVTQTPGNPNTCGASGVAVYVSCPTSLIDCVIKSNINSGCGGAVGAVRFASNLVSVSGCQFCENSCGNTNGAYLDLGNNRFPTTCASCSGDLNGDNQVNGADLGLLLTNWGPCSN